MPDATPEFADIYGLDPLVLLGGDAHNTARRAAIVEVRSDYVKALGRSSSTKHTPPTTLRSEVDLACRLDKIGVFSERFKHSVQRSAFNNPLQCEYYGTLKPAAAAELQIYWDNC